MKLQSLTDVFIGVNPLQRFGKYAKDNFFFFNFFIKLIEKNRTSFRYRTNFGGKKKIYKKLVGGVAITGCNLA